MKRMIQGLFVASVLVLLQATPVQATVDQIEGDNCRRGCGGRGGAEFPVRQGETTTVTAVGQFVDLSTALEVTGAGVTVSNAAGTSSSRKNIRIVVDANAAPGLRTIRLRYLVETSGPDTFQIVVLRNGRVTDVDVPPQNQFFTSVDVVLTGQNIGNAGIGFSSFTPPAAAELRESTDTRAVVRLTFSSPLAEASGTIALFDKACRSCQPSESLRLNYGGINATGGTGLNPVSITGPNAVASITFPAGSTVQVGSVFEIRIKLAKPAKRGIQNPLFPDRRAGAGETVHWQLVPSTAFATAPGSGTQFSPNGLNQVVIPGGDEFVNLTVQLTQLPSNCGSGCQGRIQTRVINLNTDQPPYFKEATFTMLPAPAQ